MCRLVRLQLLLRAEWDSREVLESLDVAWSESASSNFRFQKGASSYT